MRGQSQEAIAPLEAGRRIAEASGLEWATLELGWVDGGERRTAIPLVSRRERVGTLQGRTRRIAIVAMARKLLIALWRYVETGVVPDGIVIRAETTATA